MSATLLPIDAGQRPLDDHREFAGEGALERIRTMAQPLDGAALLCLTAADATGSHAPHYLRSLLPLMADLGIDVRWRALAGGTHAKVGEWLEQGLGGAEFAASDDEWDEWVEESAAALEPELVNADAVIAHDAAALGCVAATRSAVPRAAWSRHDDPSAADPGVTERLDALLADVEVADVGPATDPLSPRNHELPRQLSGRVLRSLGVDLTRPYVCQTGVIDRWTDPHTAIDAFDLIKRDVPLQLVIAGALPGEGAGDLRIAKEIDDYAANRHDVRVKTGYAGVGNVELNALQRVARVGLSLRLRPGLNIDHLETAWKGTPVIDSGEAETIAARVEELVRDPGFAVEQGAAARERVRARHMITHALEDELRLAGSLLGTVAR